MHIYFSGIGGSGIGPLALVAKQAGYTVSGSDKQNSAYLDYLRSHGITDIHIGQDYDSIRKMNDNRPIDWFVYTSALPMENPDAPELRFCADNKIHTSKRDELLNRILKDKGQKMIAVAGTHGKTTTTAMTIWTLQKLGVPISYILPAKSSFADMGHFDAKAEYFVYECDEFDRNFLAFNPEICMITGIDWDHPDIYPTRQSYYDAFRQFLSQCKQSVLWNSDVKRLNAKESDYALVIDEDDARINSMFSLPGLVNRQNAWQVAATISQLLGQPKENIYEILNNFPGVSRRFEKISKGLYSDYAHTPPKIRGALQLGHEVAGDNLVVVYEGLHNTRQHFIKDELASLFSGVRKLYIVPSYLAREDRSLKLLTPSDIKNLLDKQSREHTVPSLLGGELKDAITKHVKANDTVLFLTAGGGGSLDEWLRQEFTS